MTESTNQPPAPIVRNETTRLSAGVWGAGQSVWGPDGVTPAVDQLDVRETRDAAEIEEVLQASPLVARSRRYLVGGAPVMLAVSYVASDLAAGTPIAEADSGPGGVFARLAEIGFAPARFSEDVWAAMPTDEERDRLRLDYHVPVLRARRVAFDGGGRAVEISELVMVSYAFRLRFEFPA